MLFTSPPHSSFIYHICSSPWACFLLAILKASRKAGFYTFSTALFFVNLILFFFELFYWNTKLDKHKSSSTGKGISKAVSGGNGVPNCAPSVQLQQRKAHLNAHGTAQEEHQDPRLDQRNTSEMKPTGKWQRFSLCPCSKTRGEKPCGASQPTGRISGREAAPSPAAAASQRCSSR